MQQSAWDQSTRNNKTRFTEPLADNKSDSKKRKRTIIPDDRMLVNEEDTTIEIRCSCGTLSGEEYAGHSCDLCKTVVKPRFVVFGNRVVPQRFIRHSSQDSSDNTDQFTEPNNAESELKDASMSHSVNDESSANGNDEKAKVVVHVHNDKNNQPSKVGIVVAVCAILTCGAILGAAWYLKR